jgi:Ca2+-binding RTX toxin-like protein
LYGGDGDDTLEGGADNDHIDGGGVNCIATASAATSTTPPIVPTIGSCSSTAATSSSIGVNTLDYSDHTTAVTVDLTAFTCSGTSVTVGSTGECDILATSTTGSGSSAVTSANVRNIRGGSGNDTLTGDANDNTIWGGEGDDHINGGLGNDNLYGEGGNDTIHGYGTGSGFALTSLSGSQTDTDYVSGGPGTNVLYGDLGLNTIDSTQGWGDTVDCGPNDGNIWLSSGSTGETGTGCQL